MTKTEALKLVVPGTILKGRFRVINPMTLEVIPNMYYPLHLVNECIMCSLSKKEIVENITEINIPVKGGYKTIWKEGDAECLV